MTLLLATFAKARANFGESHELAPCIRPDLICKQLQQKILRSIARFLFPWLMT